MIYVRLTLTNLRIRRIVVKTKLELVPISNILMSNDYLAQWLWYWVTIPKVQGSNPGLTTNL